MRYLALSSVLWLCCAACADDDAARSQSNQTSPKSDAGADTKLDASSGNKDAGASARLPKPSLPRPPGSGLPAELRPPR